ncbi:granulocyte colony-stimulating factor receptor [Trichomycterus rosablanca]|uniref:granulocyte colony-stimulating factor receptor n=1 Tax=Trichomycterus rosablanca TaxID=2290929 RepID=UPI002F350216
MVLHWTSVHAVLWTFMSLFIANVRASPCAEVHTTSKVVLFGSPVTASCHFKDDCLLMNFQRLSVEWHYNNTLIQKIEASQEKKVYEIFIPSFTDRQAVLKCLVCSGDTCNIVDAVEMEAGYPPSAPENLTCQLNLMEPNTLVCKWDPGQKTLNSRTNYTLYTVISDSSERFSYVPLPEEYLYRVPRHGFTLYSTVQVFVEAVNDFGRATSELLMFNPMETAKLDPPEIKVGTKRFECLEHNWSLSRKQSWIRNSLYVEISLKPVINKLSEKEQITSFKARPGTKEVCGLLYGMLYESRMRVKYHTNSPWSEWSKPAVAFTPMSAPTGRLVTWLKLTGRLENRHQKAQLFWKPSSHFRPNSMNVSYAISVKGRNVCVTVQQYCSFQIPAGVRKFHLTAMNAKGKSWPTEVLVHRGTEMDPVSLLTVLPQSDESLLTEWASPENLIVNAYVIEWKALNDSNSSLTSFEILNKNQTSFVMTGLEPYQPYEISVYPKYKDGIGQPYSVVMFTKQKAPSVSPILKFGRIGSSYIELFWDEIPLLQRNGIITGYRVFYTDEKNNTGAVDTSAANRKVILKDLHPFSHYEIFLMTSTHGGSLNGPVITVTTVSTDAFELVLFIIPACVGFTILIFIIFACFSNNDWKKHLWPIIPDPANSNIKKWTTADSLVGMPSFKEYKDPALVYVSHFSLLSLSETNLWKGEKNLKCEKWKYDSGNADERHSDSSPDSVAYNSDQRSESVTYATVILSAPYRSQPVPPPIYLRSESTQPLLEEEESSSPRSYEKLSSQVSLSDVDQFSTFQEDLSGDENKVTVWEDFPMLSSLENHKKV